jgi:DNA-binding NarL/FixJ family response regulator
MKFDTRAPVAGLVRVACVEGDQIAYSKVEASLLAHSAKFSVQRYHTGSQAVSTLPLTRPDVVLVNSQLSDISGIEFAKRLSRLAPKLHIVMYGLQKEFRDVLLALTAGASGCVVTPCANADLLNAVRHGGFGLPFLCRRSLMCLINGLRNCDKSPNRELSWREHEVMAALIEKHSDKGVAEALHISPNTVRVHVAHLLQKLRATNRGHAIRRYLGLE